MIDKLKGITVIRRFTMQALGKELQGILKSINSAKNKETLIDNKKKLNRIANSLKKDKKLYEQTRIYIKYLYEKIEKMLTGKDIIID
ncbi:hypothetical protein J4450_05810 [Candidatus Micrarchaeota archaeon]|nr:hypothetical protein [Candidatus Micrarchaeota archaeon]